MSTAEAGQTEVEVAIVGAGMAGTTLATVLGQAGRKVALIDPHRVHHDEFRAEKIGMDQMLLFEKLGLDATVKRLVTSTTDTHVFRLGQLFAHEKKSEFTFSYGALINGLRDALPPQVPLTVGKVTEISTGPDRQRLVLADGSVISARLLVVATGHGEAVRRAVGVERVEQSKAHSLSMGFDLAISPREFAYQSATCYGRRAADRVAYISIFPLGNKMRANMFVYRTVAEPWTRAFRQDPQKMLCELMPEIAALCGNFEVASPVEVRQVSLNTTQGHRRDGVVFIGDAFCTTCPTPGVGIGRVMTDVDQLHSVHIPRWLETPGMAADKINAFYDDPVKVATDEDGMRVSYYAKSITIETGLEWRVRRLRNNTARRLMIIGRKMRHLGQRQAPVANMQ
ncbi:MULTISPECIES: NAD(P)/FAD-dependent oxidoreductase [unclassified Mesorhizobium]|jgi:2-polyprenyl-6-methoxyphenol hydroxylase-like FAD-dependent oxidoreductase|uniref:FAD-dependent oxidoreductase n=1 Tax=unclassified Mesorhizobium TaxID=325217 RepID=UPI000FCBE9E0|nr:MULTISPECIES: NAD(P)/FAD-dependent oxidoreductase [unclassified Mesorhizobium]RUX93712.1 FAD-dependent monooxygenase [Mesorhizobium sp. M7D.F.Ca.US.004.01.2.1]RVA33245.1 FAD-dependent monooxygenase [Mesorhizobium sp. M7D.F.Ca.US.004.03.1.1]